MFDRFSSLSFRAILIWAGIWAAFVFSAGVVATKLTIEVAEINARTEEPSFGITWYMYRTYVEYTKFREAVWRAKFDDEAIEIDDIWLLGEIFLSRRMDSDTVLKLQATVNPEKVESFIAMLDAFSDSYDVLYRENRSSKRELAVQLASKLEILRAPLEDILTFTRHEEAEKLERSRAERTAAIHNLNTIIIAHFVIAFLLATILIVQLRNSLEKRNKLQAMNELLVIAEGKARSASEMKGAFLACVTHELRTPLNAILGFSEVLKDQSLGAATAKKTVGYAEDIWNAGNHLLSMINDLLDLSKAAANQVDLQKTSFELGKLVQSTVSMLASIAAEKKIEVSLALPDALPPIIADETRVRQILLNILSNAIKYTNSGGFVAVKVELKESGAFVVTVADTGIGIAAKDVDTVLEPFGRIHNAMARTTEGTGLGLPLAKKLMEAHAGFLEITSVLGKGTTVTLSFPQTNIQLKTVAKLPFVRQAL